MTDRLPEPLSAEEEYAIRAVMEIHAGTEGDITPNEAVRLVPRLFATLDKARSIGTPGPGEYRSARIRALPLPPDLDEIEGRWAASWGESDDGIRRAWRDDVATLIDALRADLVICGVIWPGGPNSEPLACGFPPNPPDEPMHVHSWAGLPTIAAAPAPVAHSHGGQPCEPSLDYQRGFQDAIQAAPDRPDPALRAALERIAALERYPKERTYIEALFEAWDERLAELGPLDPERAPYIAHLMKTILSPEQDNELEWLDAFPSGIEDRVAPRHRTGDKP